MNRFLNLQEELETFAGMHSLVLSQSKSTAKNVKKLKEIRTKARFRVQRAYLKLNGTHPTNGKKWRREGLSLARKLIDPKIQNINSVVNVLRTMHTVLSAEKRFTIKYNKKLCKSWGAYYNSRDRLIHLCPQFFKSSEEEQIRYLVHESAHAAGIVSKTPENYLIGFDCSTPTKPSWNMADYWVHFIHCLLGLPQQSFNITATAPASRKGGSSATQPAPSTTKSIIDLWENEIAEAKVKTDWPQVKYNIVRILEEEQGDVWRDYHSAKHKIFKESDKGMLPVLEKYWKDGVGVSNWKSQAKKSADNKVAWSAAYISWVIREAGITSAHGFKFSGRHMDYIAEALRNREGEKQYNATKNAAYKKYLNKSAWLYDISEQGTVKIKEGDILCMNRRVNKRMTTHSYANLKKKFFDGNNYKTSKTYGSSHCDAVAQTNIKRGNKFFMEASGGNKAIKGQGGRGWTVNSIDVEIDKNGLILNPAAKHIFAFIRFRNI